jgi:hypothetical protein
MDLYEVVGDTRSKFDRRSEKDRPVVDLRLWKYESSRETFEVGGCCIEENDRHTMPIE